jgi:hypothetical protein
MVVASLYVYIQWKLSNPDSNGRRISEVSYFSGSKNRYWQRKRYSRQHHFRQSHVTPTNTTHAGHVGMGFLTLAALLPPRPMSGKSDMDGGATSLHDKQDRVIDAGRQKNQPENSTVLTLTRKRDRF